MSIIAAMDYDPDELLATGKRVLALESAALHELSETLDPAFTRACMLILACKGRLIITGMGKSGHVAQKIAASLTSTGTPAHFLHPAEGVHGDLGAVHKADALLAISFSGETEEILDLLGPLKRIGAPVIAITGQPDSTLARQADIVLLIGAAKEADPHNLVPTTSTTLTLALGDALTIALMQARHFTPEDFAVFHPRGMLGKRLTLHVRDLLLGEETNPVVSISATFGEALDVITRYMLGGVNIIDDDGQLAGIITDGDVRRIIRHFISSGGTVAEAIATRVDELMTRNPTAISEDTLAYDALKLMENHKPRPVFILPVLDATSHPVGMLHLHTLVQAGFRTARKDD
jgi:arabinose-5-phosphate isomerase